MDIYTPDATRVVHYTSVDLSKRHISDPIHVVQYDDKLPLIAVSIYNDGDLYIIPDDAVINIRYGKPDYTFVYNPALGISSDKTKVYFEITYQMTVIPGEYQPIIEVVSGSNVGGTSNIPVNVDKNPITNGMIESTIEFKLLVDYVYEAKGYAEGAKESETNAKTSEDNAKESETNAKTSEDNAKESETNAITAATNAETSAANAKISEDNAKVSETNTAISAANAKISEDNAKVSETNAKTSEDNTKEYYDDTVEFWNDANNEVLTNEVIRQENEEERKANELLREAKYDEMVDATAESILQTQAAKDATQDSVELTTIIQEKLDNGEFKGTSGVWVGADNPPNEEYVVWVDPEATEGEFATVAITGSYNDLKDKPESLPANGGNADTLGGVSADEISTEINKVKKSVDNLSNLNNSINEFTPSNTEYNTLLDYIIYDLLPKGLSYYSFCTSVFSDLPSPDWKYTCECINGCGLIYVRLYKHLHNDLIYVRGIDSTHVWLSDWAEILMSSKAANDLVTNQPGYYLDARQGKVLKDTIDQYNIGYHTREALNAGTIYSFIAEKMLLGYYGGDIITTGYFLPEDAYVDESGRIVEWGVIHWIRSGSLIAHITFYGDRLTDVAVRSICPAENYDTGWVNK